MSPAIILVALSLTVALVSALADRRRARRTDLDRAGWMPWPLLLILALIVAATATAVALKSG